MIIVGLLYPGEMGCAIAALLQAGGREVVTTLNGRSKATAERAQRQGITVLPDLATLSTKSDVVITLLPPSAVIQVAQDYASQAPSGGAPYVDMNVKSISDVENLAGIMASAGIEFTNACLIGKPEDLHTSGHFYTSGAACLAFERAFDGLLPVSDLGLVAKKATLFKMVFASFNKAVTAALFETAVTAHGFGIYDEIIEELKCKIPNILNEMSGLVPSYARHLHRRGEEMATLATTLEQAGLANLVAEAAANTFRNLERKEIFQKLPAGAAMDDMLCSLKAAIDQP